VSACIIMQPWINIKIYFTHTYIPAPHYYSMKYNRLTSSIKSDLHLQIYHDTREVPFDLNCGKWYTFKYNVLHLWLSTNVFKF
jgi:hypothetical protein